MNKHTLFFLLPLVLAGCGGGGGGGSIAPALTAAPPGVLGGHNIGLTVTATGAQVQLTCSGGGTISQPLLLDAGGGFDVPGTITPGLGPPSGPVPLPPATARYSGTTDGKTLRLTITPDDTRLTPSTYTLAYGVVPTFDSQPCPL